MPRPCKLTFDLMTLKAVSESRVTRATPVSILVFLGLFSTWTPYYMPQTSNRRQTRIGRLMPPLLRRGIINEPKSTIVEIIGLMPIEVFV